MDARYRIVRDPVHGFRRLDPLPDDDEVAGFYESRYYELVRDGRRAPDLRRLLAGGPEAERERAWLRATLYEDIVAILDELGAGPGRRLLDVGCGTGEFLRHMEQAGWNAEGLELSPEAAALAGKAGSIVHTKTVRQLASERREGRDGFGAVSLLHVLEHAPDPAGLLRDARALLVPGGFLVIQVPNDFSDLQLAAQHDGRREPWWVAVPDHIHYFDFGSLRSMLAAAGFDTVRAQGTFPMELFLLMGDDYVSDPSTGGACHARRSRFEMAIPGELRRRIYRALGEVGIGRDCLVFGRRRREP